MLLHLLISFLRPHWRLLVVVVAFQLLQSVASLFLPTLNAAIIDQGIATGDTAFIVMTGAIMLIITLVQVACAIVAVYFGSKAAMAMGRDMRLAVFSTVAAFSDREVTRFGAPSLLTRTTNDVQQVQMLVLLTCTLLVSAPILFFGGIAVALTLDLQLSWIIAVAFPLLLLALLLIVARMVPLFELMQERIDAINGVLREQLTGIRVIRAFVRERQETGRFEHANEEVTETTVRAGRLFALMFPLVTLVINLSSVAVLWFGAFRVEDGSIEVGTLTAFLTYLLQILMAVLTATFMAVLIPRAAVCAVRINEVLETEPSVVVAEHPVTELAGRGEVEFADVSFSYPGAEQPILRGVSFTGAGGEITAIVGSTGSGKTTLVSLLPRLFDATGGAVRVDGRDVRELDPDLLWSRIGLVPQNAYLFSGTIASNLRYGKPDASADELWEALETAQAAEFVRALPEKLEAPIAQGGVNVSGGQRQRLAIARALVKRPEIYIFDDSFSALDTKTDADLRAALRRERPEASMIVVAQRISSIVHADRIVVLEDGSIVAQGTHDQLLDSSDTYREIVESQLEAEDAR